MEKKAFGNTGHMSSRIIYGAAGLGRASEKDTDRTIEVLLENEINHIDVAAGYAAGESEKRVGVWMQQYRDKFFLATKTGQRTYREAKDEFHASLQRLQVESVDLIQMHNLTDPDDWQYRHGTGRCSGGPRGGSRARVDPLHRRDGPRSHRGQRCTCRASSALTWTLCSCPTTTRLWRYPSTPRTFTS